MESRFSYFCSVLALTVAPLAYSQDTPPQPGDTKQDSTAPPAAAPAPPPSAWTQHGIDIYLLGDVFGDINFNHPASERNQLYNFDDIANQGHLNFAKISLEKASGILGFRVDAGLGRALDIASAGDNADQGFKYLEQMYVEFRPPDTHGIEIDFGKFVTSAGAEVIESNNNWNYSRSLLFALAIPYYHFGVRVNIPVTKALTTGFQVVNGWNSLGTNNGFDTVGVIGNYAWKKVTWNNSYYTGHQQEGLLRSYRQIYDTNVVIAANDKTNVYLNFDYGSDKLPAAGRTNWTGFAAAGRYQLTKRFAFAPRVEVYDDMDGFSTGVAQTLGEFTLTGEMKIHDGLISRLEYRRDMADHRYFDRGAQAMVAKDQSTLALAFIAFFGPKK